MAERLLVWLELFEQDFSRESQRGALRRYVVGLLSGSRRKSMEAMWAPSQRSRHVSGRFSISSLTHAPWDAEAVWQQLRARVPARTGVLTLDGTSFPKQGLASVGVARQCCGARHDRQLSDGRHGGVVAGARAWLLGAAMYLPVEGVATRQLSRSERSH